MEAVQQAYAEALRTSQAAGNLFLGLHAGSKLAVTLKEQGHYHRAEQICQQPLRSVGGLIALDEGAGCRGAGHARCRDGFPGEGIGLAEEGFIAVII